MMRSFVALLSGFLSLAAAADPVRTAVFVGDGPRGRGCVEWLRLIAGSPELDLKLVDAKMVRQGALDDADVLVMPGGASVNEKKDLGPAGAESVKAFIRRGGGYIGTCAGCCLLLDERTDPDRGIGVIPYHRLGNKGGFMMPIAVNASGAKAMGIPEKSYPVSYHAGPILVPSTNIIAGAQFEVWATFDSDFDCPKSELRMYGNVAMVGGTYGKGRVYAIACHPEANVLTYDLVKGAFRYVLGREVSFPVRIRSPKALTVGMFASGISGLETARTVLALDGLDGVDFFPLTSDEVAGNWLDRVDCLVLPDGNQKFYAKKLNGRTKELVESFAAAGGRVLAWGCGADFAPKGATIFPSGDALVGFVRRRVASANVADAPNGVFDSGVGGLTDRVRFNSVIEPLPAVRKHLSAR